MAISIAKITRTSRRISSAATSLFLIGHLNELVSLVLIALQERVALTIADYLSGAAVSGRMCTVLPATRLTGGLRMTRSPALIPVSTSMRVPKSRFTPTCGFPPCHRY
jgi:hypothetical protein